METPAAAGRTIEFSQVPGKELDEYCGREDGCSIDAAGPEMWVQDAQRIPLGGLHQNPTTTTRQHYGVHMPAQTDHGSRCFFSATCTMTTPQ